MNMSIGYTPLLPIATTVFLVVLVASGFAALADWLARRHGARMILPLWLAGTVLIDGAFVLRLSRLQAGMNVPDDFAAPLPAFWLYFPMWAMTLGAVALYIARRHRKGKVGFTIGVALASTGLFMAGAIASSVVYLLWELVPAL